MLSDKDGAKRSSDGALGGGANFTLTGDNVKKNEALAKNIRFTIVDITGTTPAYVATLCPDLVGATYAKDAKLALQLCAPADGAAAATS